MDKKIEDLKSWGDLASRFDLTLFNCLPNINNGAMLEEWSEIHTCESIEARNHIEGCEIKDCKKCKELIEEFGEYPECECEPYQWYIIDIDKFDFKALNDEFDLDIFYSETIDNYILPVYHFGTSWRIMGLKGGYVNL